MRLSPREFEFLRLRALGNTSDATAIEKGVGRQHVTNTLTSAYQKLGVHCFEDAARALGWLDVPDTPAGAARPRSLQRHSPGADR